MSDTNDNSKINEFNRLHAPPKEPQPAPEQGVEEMYPCSKCGKLRTKDEGGTTFTVCDDCWPKPYPEGAGAEEFAKGGDSSVPGYRDGLKDGYLEGYSKGRASQDARIAALEAENKRLKLTAECFRVTDDERIKLTAAEKRVAELEAQVAEAQKETRQNNSECAALVNSLRASLALARDALVRVKTGYNRSTLHDPSRGIEKAVNAALSQLPGVEKDAERGSDGNAG